jgi:hypothetical protein
VRFVCSVANVLTLLNESPQSRFENFTQKISVFRADMAGGERSIKN